MSDVAWMDVAKSLLGEEEVSGAKANPKILGLFKAVGWDPGARGDEEPWCGAYVGYCMIRSGCDVPDVAVRATAWLEWGTPCEPRHGAVAVVKRKGGHHVAFVYKITDDKIYLLGGNQGDTVSIAAWKKSALVGCRWPGNKPPGDPNVSQSRIANGGQAVKWTGKVVTAGGAAKVTEEVAKQVAPTEWTTTLTSYLNLGEAINSVAAFAANYWWIAAIMAGVVLWDQGSKIVNARKEDALRGKTVV